MSYPMSKKCTKEVPDPFCKITRHQTAWCTCLQIRRGSIKNQWHCRVSANGKHVVCVSEKSTILHIFPTRTKCEASLLPVLQSRRHGGSSRRHCGLLNGSCRGQQWASCESGYRFILCLAFCLYTIGKCHIIACQDSYAIPIYPHYTIITKENPNFN